MNWVDVVLLAIVAFSGMLGFMRGLVREILGLAAWVGAVVAAIWSFPQAQAIARRTIQNPDLADPVAFGVVFLFVLIVLSLVARGLSHAVRHTGLGGLDRTLGLVYGLARGAVVLIAAYIIAGVIEPVDRWPDDVLAARTLPSIYLGSVWVVQHMPPQYQPALPVPPTDLSPSSADLLHASPVGRALGTPPAHP